MGHVWFSATLPAQPVMQTGETKARPWRGRTRDGAGRTRRVPDKCHGRVRSRNGAAEPRIGHYHGSDGTFFCDPSEQYCAAAPGIERKCTGLRAAVNHLRSGPAQSRPAPPSGSPKRETFFRIRKPTRGRSRRRSQCRETALRGNPAGLPAALARLRRPRRVHDAAGCMVRRNLPTAPLQPGRRERKAVVSEVFLANVRRAPSWVKMRDDTVAVHATPNRPGSSPSTSIPSSLRSFRSAQRFPFENRHPENFLYTLENPDTSVLPQSSASATFQGLTTLILHA